MTDLEKIGQKAWERSNGKIGEWPKTLTFNKPGRYNVLITDTITVVDKREMYLNYTE